MKTERSAFNSRRSPSRITRAEPSRRRSHLLRRVVLLVVVVVVGALALRAYFLDIYAPGFRAEASHIPALVQAQLAAHHAGYVPFDQISPNMREAIVAVEDRRFYHHQGVDLLAVLRAAWVNLQAKHVDQGGSTLEEQLAKRAIVGRDNTIRAKLRAMGLAWALDQEFTKAQVLELYLNDAYFGQGAYGIGEAARIYFGTSAATLTVSQAAFLAALPQAPSIYGSNPRAPVIVHRQHTVLGDMRQQGYITSEEERAALRTPLTFALPNP